MFHYTVCNKVTNEIYVSSSSMERARLMVEKMHLPPSMLEVVVSYNGIDAGTQSYREMTSMQVLI